MRLLFAANLCTDLQGYLSCSLQGAFYFKSQSNRAVPNITAKEIEALRYACVPLSKYLSPNHEMNVFQY